MNIGKISKASKIYVSGHKGMVGSALVRCLKKHGYMNLITRTRGELDLTEQQSVNEFFANEKPEVVLFAAAKVGGIYANNTYPAEFIYDNISIATNLIHAAYKNNAARFIFLGSSCIYPKFAPQPMSENALLTSALEPTNEAYAIAKIAGLKMCEYYHKQYGCNFSSIMPTNLYGINDHYDEFNSHVLPALIRKIHEAKVNNVSEVQIWGTGQARREFLLSDDLAEAIICVMENNDLDFYESIINVGCGEDIKIAELAQTIAHVIGYEGKFVFDTSKPDGTPRKLLDISKIKKLGWSPKTSLEEGIKIAYADFCQRYAS